MAFNSIAVKYASKASGVYREIIDATISNLDVAAPCNVVVVIQSEQGAVMKPIYCADKTQLHTMFGHRDAKLETRGNFGILMAEHVLEQGPIWVLNVKNINPQSETVMVKKLACSSAEKDTLQNLQINQVYDTNKFWNIPLVYGTYGEGGLLSFTSVLNGTATVVVEKYNGDGYNYTVGYTKELHEEFLGQGYDDDDLVRDHIISVHIFKTDLLNAKLSVENAIINGEVNLDQAVLEKLFEDPNSKYYASYTGSVGSLIDADGNNLNVVKLINADTYAHGIYAAVNMNTLIENGIDLACKGAYVFDTTGAELPTVRQVSRLGYKFTPLSHKITGKVNKFNRTQLFITGEPGFDETSVFADREKTLRARKITYLTDTYKLDPSIKPFSISAPIQASGKPFEKNADGSPIYPADSIKAGQALDVIDSSWLTNQIYTYKIDPNTDAPIYDETTGQYETKLVMVTQDMIDAGLILDWRANVNITKNTVSDIMLPADATQLKVAATGILNGTRITKDVSITGITDYNRIDKIKNGMAILFNSFLTGLSFEITAETADTKIAVSAEPINVPKTCRSFKLETVTGLSGDYNDDFSESYAIGTLPSIVASYAETEEPVLIDKFDNYDVLALTELYGDKTPVYQVTFDKPLVEVPGESAGTVEVFGEVTATVANYELLYLEDWTKIETSYKPMVLTGIKSLEKHFVNGTRARQNDVLDMLNSEGIINSFIDPTIFRCRYMVDTFKTYIEPNAKYQFARLAGEAKRFLVFSPGPFYHELLASKNPDFHDLLGNFKMEYVKNGKNPNKPSTNSFSFVQDAEYSKYMVFVMNAYYNNGYEDTLVPYVGAMAKLYYSKHTGTHKVYDIIGGKDWPLVAEGLTMPEFEPESGERAQMEQFGLNVVQKIDGVTQLRSDKTAFQWVSSAFNYPETLEKIFYISDMVEPTLDGKLFKYNNADTRLAVKKRADDVCDLLVSDGAVAAYVNTCDLSNNDEEVRKKGIIILDTELWNEYGIRIAVHRSTVRTEEAS